MTLPFSRLAGPGISLADVARATHATLTSDTAVTVGGIRHDSREVLPGELFLARKGQHTDGLAYLDQAIRRGACGVIVEREHAPSSLHVPLLLVDDARMALARAAAAIYGDPSRDMDVVGITGTNGKTTTAEQLRVILRAAGHHPAVLGTLGAQYGTHTFELLHNTPEADELTRVLAWFRDQGASHVVMEATSHALAQKRVDGVRFRVGAFTNLTHDHLDLHGDFGAYGRAKARLFLELEPALSVIMVDDPFGAELASSLTRPVLRVSRRADVRADVCPVSGELEVARCIDRRVGTPWGPVEIQSPLFGEHNLANLLLALSIAMGMGLNLTEVAEALAEAQAPLGRLERCDGPEDGVIVFVDYAHTPDGLEKALTAVREWTSGRVLCVFGCGGDRDPTKRAPMGRVVGRLADVAVVTSDNPRRESPEAIARAMVQGVESESAELVIELDRARAIGWAIEAARDGDVVLVAGKGHETKQVVGTRALPFDDRVHVRRALSHRARG